MSILSMFSYHFIQRALVVGVLVSLCAALRSEDHTSELQSRE